MNTTKKLFPLMEYAGQLDTVLHSLPEEAVRSILLNIVTYDRSIRYELVARYIPLQLDQLVHLIRSYVQELKQENTAISEAGANEVERLTNTLTERGRELLADGKYLEAADMGFAIVLAIEPELHHVQGEGITYQMIIEETFIFLTDIAQAISNAKTAAVLRETTSNYYLSRSIEDRYFDDEWRDLLTQFR